MTGKQTGDSRGSAGRPPEPGPDPAGPSALPPEIAEGDRSEAARRKTGDRRRPVAGGRSATVPSKGPSPEAAARREEARAAAREKRLEEQRRRQAATRRRQVRTGILVSVAVLVVAGGIAYGAVHAKQSRKTFATLSAATGCTDVQDTNPGGNTLSRQHLSTDDIARGMTVTYSTSPPTGGEHHPTPLSHGAFTAPLSTNPADTPNLYQAVHSLEHGYVIVWYRGLSGQQVASLIPFGDQDKVIVVSYPQLPRGSIALTAWGRLQYCNQMNRKQIQSFIDLYKLKTGPEPLAP